MLNKHMLIGNLGADPKIAATNGGTTVASFRVATTETYKDKTGKKVEQTEWHNVVAYGRLADICKEYLGKGSKVYIEGKSQTRKWQGKDGQDRYTTEIIAREMKMLSPKGQGDAVTAPPSHEEPPLPEPTGDDIPM